MAEVINLRTFRKQAARKAAGTEAEANAVKFGRTAAQKKREAEDASRAKAALDGHKLEE